MNVLTRTATCVCGQRQLHLVCHKKLGHVSYNTSDLLVHKHKISLLLVMPVNRNINIVCFWMYAVGSRDFSYTTADHKYMLSGHSYLDFGAIKKVSRRSNMCLSQKNGVSWLKEHGSEIRLRLNEHQLVISSPLKMFMH